MFGDFSLALKSADGSCWAWGANTYGQLGDNSLTNRSSPVSVVGSHSFTAIAGGYTHSLGLKSADGSCWAWGANSDGRLGDNSTTDRSSPVSVVGGHSFSTIAGGGSHSLGLKSADGSCWAWGYNYPGQLGDNSTTTRSSPVSVVGGHSFSAIAGGYTHSLGLKSSDGSCWAWGANSDGRLGDNSTTNRSSPVSVVGSHSFTTIAGGISHSLGLKSANGSCWAWGWNNAGQLGDNSVTNRSSSVSVVGGHSFATIAGGYSHSLGLKSSDGSCWAWGDNSYGQLGDNSTTWRSSPVSVVGSHSFSAIAGGGYHSLGLKANGECWSWGKRTYGQLGDNSITNRSSPVSVVGAHSFTTIAGGYWHSLALKSSDGSCWAWGSNYSGQLGDNSTTDRSSPVSVVGAHSFTTIAGGTDHSLGLKSSDGSCWAWGENGFGALGDNSMTKRSSPVSVVGAHSFTAIAAGDYHSLGLKSADGSCWAWGWNFSGPLGDNSTTNRSSPVSVVGAHSFTTIAGGYWHSLALKSSDGSCWAWGANSSGQLGNNSMTKRSSPVSVVGAHSFTAIAANYNHSLALKSSDGSCWAWGWNNAGQLGDNSTTWRSSPVSVVGSHSFTTIAAGDYHSLGLKSSDGSCWAWGENQYYGQLGDNSTTNRSSPVSVVGSHSFSAIAAGSSHSLGLKANGEYWSWGSDQYGQLGINVGSVKFSPVLVVGAHLFSLLMDNLPEEAAAPQAIVIQIEGGVSIEGGVTIK